MTKQPRRIIMMKGLPASGKTTYAKKLQRESPGKYKRINKDTIREMLDDGKHSKDNEKFINNVRDFLVWNILDTTKCDIVVDDTNFNPYHEKSIKDIASMHSDLTGEKVEVKTVYMDVTPNIALSRNRDRKDKPPVPDEAINKMYEQYIKPKEVQKSFKRNEALQDVYIVDLDGTLALHNGRDPYDASRCETDILNEPVYDILESIIGKDTKIFFVSGRDEAYIHETVAWLRARAPYLIDNCVGLVMRPSKDRRPDYEVKKELYDKYIKDRFNVQAVFDDRQQVVDMWRSVGLTCLQVAKGDF